jgi:hypothetical protein
MSQETMTAQEAKKEFDKVGLSESTVRRWARIKKIQRVKNGLYVRSSVDNALNEFRGEQKKKAKKEEYQYSQVRLATPEDSTGIAILVAAMFGGQPNPDRWASWIEKNPDIAYVGMIQRGMIDEMVISCGFVVPHREKKILSILSQEITPPTRLDEILEYRAGEHVCLYARTICVAENDTDCQGYSYAQRKVWATGLLLAMTRGVIELGARGVIIDKMYGRSDSKDGERAMRTLGCTEIKTSTTHRNFVIDFPASGLNMVRRYEQQFLEWQRKQSGE